MVARQQRYPNKEPHNIMQNAQRKSENGKQTHISTYFIYLKSIVLRFKMFNNKWFLYAQFCLARSQEEETFTLRCLSYFFVFYYKQFCYERNIMNETNKQGNKTCAMILLHIKNS